MLRSRRREGGRNPKISGRPTLRYYRSGSSPTKSPFQKRPRSKKRGLFGRIIDWFVILVVLAGAIYSLILQPEPRMFLSTDEYRSSQIYGDATKEILKSVKNRNKLTFDEGDLRAGLSQKFPEISDVAVSIPLVGRRPSINLTIAKPSLVLRGADGTFGANERFIIDSKGTVVGPQSDFPGTKDLPLITDETGFVAGSGKAVLSLADVNFILTVIAQSKKADVPIASLTLPKLAQEVYLRTSDRGYYVKFYLGGDALAQTGQFLAARKKFDETNNQPKQYLDVRVNGKIYYK